MDTDNDTFSDRADRLFERNRGDSLGLAGDPEARLTLLDGAGARYAARPNPELLADWKAMVEDLEQSRSLDWPDDWLARLRYQRQALDIAIRANPG